MFKEKFTFSFICILATFLSFSQVQKKTLQTNFSEEKISIDGKFDEPIWKTTPIATDFVMLAPDNGKPEQKERKTEVKVVYNNDAIYIAATLYDNEPTKIRKELTTRDNFVSADHFGVFINGYNDGQQEFRFFVSAAGVQQDVLYTDGQGEDSSWDAIWNSHVEIKDFGWVVEMKIPYAAIRFSSEKKQTWGLNFYREIFRDRFQYSWNLIDNKISSESNQAGILEGIENIKTPTRLFLIPYISQYLNTNDYTKAKGEFKGGLDIKYGINDAFTLDAILVPDFGQAAFDKVVLNLGPFEQQFNENRPFFTEGTDLFNKGNIFYSRRIGGRPSLRGSELNAKLEADEEAVEIPGKVNLLNALKISGRTKGGLGIGVLNAVTEKTYADITNTTTGNTRREVIEPLANFNILVLDQRFRKNSSVSFINTNVTRNQEFRDANVSALVFDLNTKKNTYNLNGGFKYSYINEYGDKKDKKGYNTDLYFGDTSGKYRYGVGGQYVSDKYDPNDLGIFFQNHYQAYYGNASYRILKPSKKFNSFSTNINYYTEFDNRTGRIQEHSVNLNYNSVNKKNNYFGFGFNGRPTDVYDFYTPRSLDQRKYVTQPKRFGGNIFISTNYAKKFAIDFSPFMNYLNEKGRKNYGLFFAPRYRFSDKLALVYEFSFDRQNNDKGFLTTDGSNTIFARRDVISYSNSISGKYSLNNVMNLNLVVRKYWSYVTNHQYYLLLSNGELLDGVSTTTNTDENFATWNLDLSYTWWFAPGSQLSVLYRNNSFLSDYGTDFSRSLTKTANNLINHEKLDHIFSISIRYFIDYNSTKNWFSKK
ncbi:hypothetical protein GCM10028861_04060 [Flavobacterium koreense]